MHTWAALVAAALSAATAAGCCSFCGAGDCGDDRWVHRRPLAGRWEHWKTRCVEHFTEQPVAAPHSRFHPVPTRPVFSPPPAEVLAAFVAPAEKAEQPMPETDNRGAKPIDEQPDEQPQEPGASPDAMDAVPTRTASGKHRAPPAQFDDTGNGEVENQPAAAVVRSTFVPAESGLPAPEVSIAPPLEADAPLLWRAIPTPAGSLRAVPADDENARRMFDGYQMMQ